MGNGAIGYRAHPRLYCLSMLSKKVQIGTYALHMHKAYNQSPNCRFVGDMTSSRYAFDHCLTLPLYHDMTLQDQDYVVSQLLALLK